MTYMNTAQLKYNIILDTDSYKNDHGRMLPKGTKKIFSTIVFRKSNKYTSFIKFFGITYAVKQLLDVIVTYEDVCNARKIIESNGYEFDSDRWIYILDVHNGKLPIEVKSVPEGMILPVGTPVITIVNTDDNCAWLVSYLETALQRIIWKMTTVASTTYELYKFLETTMIRHEGHNNVEYMLHNFGARGADSYESNIMASMSHIAAGFKGTDALNTDLAIHHYYNNGNWNLYKGYCSSVIASEHSVMCANSNADERDDEEAIVMMLKLLRSELDKISQGKKGCPVISIVGDTYDIHRVCKDLIGKKYKDECLNLINDGGTIVIRPDSGDPILEPIKCIKLLMDSFGYKLNEFGYKVFAIPNLKILQGDGINRESIGKIIEELEKQKISLSCIIFGMGGSLTHGNGRDEFSCSMKATAMMNSDNEWIDLFKDPITDVGKRSLKGRVTTYVKHIDEFNDKIFAERIDMDKLLDIEDIMKTVFINGEVIYDNLPKSFDDVIKN